MNTQDKIASGEINFIKIEYTKYLTDWLEKSSSESKETESFKSKYLDKPTLRFFRSLGGKESVKQGRLHGYGCTINTSISPCGTEKKVSYFFY